MIPATDAIAGCQGKRAYQSRGQALATIERTVRAKGFKPDLTGAKLNAYVCRTCGCWHVGNGL